MGNLLFLVVLIWDFSTNHKLYLLPCYQWLQFWLFSPIYDLLLKSWNISKIVFCKRKNWIFLNFCCMFLNPNNFSDLNSNCSNILKFIYSEKTTKILRNLPLTFDYSTYNQKLGEDFTKFCGLLRIYELYLYSIFTNAIPIL